MLELFWKFLFEIWVYHFPIAVVGNILLYLVFLLTKRNALVDFGWGFNQIIMTIAFPLINPNVLNWKTIIITILIIFWGWRLTLFILFTRIFVNYSDTRYNEMAKNSTKSKMYFWYFLQFLFQSVLVMFPFSVVFWVYQSIDIITWNFYLGLIISIISLILETISDIQWENYKKSKKKLKQKNSDDLNLSKIIRRK